MDKLKECKTVTFGVIAYNEQSYLPELLDDLINQTYPKNLTEVILVDGGSQDTTWKIMSSFKDKYENDYLSIKLLHNKKKVQPAGWNVVINNAGADVILRIDAHARLPHDFIQQNIACINSGENVCGGPRENIIDENTVWKRMLLDAEQSLFGAGIASYRQETKEIKYVSSVFHGAYRKEVFDKVGLFNEKLIRTEDNEIHYRIRKAGYRICYNPDIKSYYQTRNTLPKMLKQKFQNGLWIGKTLKVCPKCISIFHLVPFAFVMAIVVCMLLSVFKLWQFGVLLAVAYGLFLLVNTITCICKSKNIADLLLPIVYFLMHICYGVGTVVGIVER